MFANLRLFVVFRALTWFRAGLPSARRGLKPQLVCTGRIERSGQSTPTGYQPPLLGSGGEVGRLLQFRGHDYI